METDPSSSIPRSSHRLERGLLLLLFNLSIKHAWLIRRQAELSDLFELCTSVEQQHLIADLLHRFNYIDSNALALAVETMRDKICIEWGLKPASTIIVASNNSRYSDSSQAILWHLKPVLSPVADWNTSNFVSKLSEAVDLVADGGSIVLVDEFVGSGESIAKALKWLQDKLRCSNKNATLYACVVAAMEASKTAIQNTGAKFEAANWLNKGISDHYKDEDLLAAIKQMTDIENLLENQVNGYSLKNYRFGYKRSESIYYFDNGNIPNNVFPVFWWKQLKGKIPRKTLFARI